MHTWLCNATGECKFKQNIKIYKEREAMPESMSHLVWAACDKSKLTPKCNLE
jgi:hypothetical protein